MTKWCFPKSTIKRSALSTTSIQRWVSLRTTPPGLKFRHLIFLFSKEWAIPTSQNKFLPALSPCDSRGNQGSSEIPGHSWLSSLACTDIQAGLADTTQDLPGASCPAILTLCLGSFSRESQCILVNNLALPAFNQKNPSEESHNFSNWSSENQLLCRHLPCS